MTLDELISIDEMLVNEISIDEMSVDVIIVDEMAWYH